MNEKAEVLSPMADGSFWNPHLRPGSVQLTKAVQSCHDADFSICSTFTPLPAEGETVPSQIQLACNCS